MVRFALILILLAVDILTFPLSLSLFVTLSSL